MKSHFALAALALGLATTAASADAIEGTWKRPNGHLVKFAACGSAFCATAISGPHAGGNAGKLSPAGGSKYAGSLTDLDSNKTYTGKGSISGSTLTVSGCVLGGLLCRSESWTRQ
jgi:uncharacterized protein (DUF2147 family)